MNRLSIVLTIAIGLAGCGRAEHKPSAHATAASAINAECKSGHRTGPECDAAGRAVTKAQHEEAASTFRNMTGAR